MDARDFKYNGWLADYDLEMSADRYHSRFVDDSDWDEEEYWRSQYEDKYDEERK